MIILSSASPRRKEILENHGIKPMIIRPEVDEEIPSGFSTMTSVEQNVMLIALKKALWVNNEHFGGNGDLRPDAEYIIAADTIVYDKKIIGKPSDNDEAFSILTSLKGKSHHVMTGVSIIDLNTNNITMFCDVSKVYFDNYSDEDILKYIRTESPLDKAGAYAIQGSWGKHVEKIEGDLENIIGLPWYRIKPIIKNTRR